MSRPGLCLLRYFSRISAENIGYQKICHCQVSVAKTVVTFVVGAFTGNLFTSPLAVALALVTVVALIFIVFPVSFCRIMLRKDHSPQPYMSGAGALADSEAAGARVHIKWIYSAEPSE